MKVCAGMALIAFIFGLLCRGGGGTFEFYEGAYRLDAQVATIDVSRKTLYLMSIDTLKHRYEAFRYAVIRVLPGEHTIGVNYSSWKGSSSRPIELTSNAEAGHYYNVKAEAGYRQWKAWIIDTANDSVVCDHPKEFMNYSLLRNL